MTPRRFASSLPLIAFLLGGVLGPVWHLIDHGHPHSHGTQGTTAAVHRASERNAAPAAAPHTHSHPHEIPLATSHAHPHPHTPPVAHGPIPTSTGTLPEPDRDDASEPVPGDHGRFSAEHFGLALLNVSALPPEPRPEPSGAAPVVPSIAPHRLLRSWVPFQRPPPHSISI